MPNINTKVKRFRTGYSDPRISNVDIEKRNKEYRQFKEAANRQAYYDATREAAYADKVKKEQAHYEALVPRVVNDLALEARRVYPEIIFREYFTQLVKESLLWDKEFIDETSNGIRYMSHKYIAEAIGGLEGLKEAAKKHNSTYLKKVYDVCMETGKTLTKKKKAELEKNINASNADNAKLDFTIDTDGEELITKNLSELNIEDISEMVKKNVLQVVKDENESQKKDDEFISNLKEDIQSSEAEEKIPEDQVKSMTVNNGDAPSDATASTPSGGDSSTEAAGGKSSKKKDDSGDDDTASEDDLDEKRSETKKSDTPTPKKDDKKSEDSDSKTENDKADDDKKTKEDATKESLEKYALDGHVSVERSLFRSMMARSYYKATMENAGAASAGQLNDKNSQHEHGHNVAGVPGNVNVYDIYLQDENEDLSYIDFAKNSMTNCIGDNNKIDKDEILAEAIGMYTILECAWVIKLITPTERELRRVIRHNIKA